MIDRRVILIAVTIIAFAPGRLCASLKPIVMNSGPERPAGLAAMEPGEISELAVMLDDVPTSGWTYGCSPTAAGMIFGYYDRNGYAEMYTGPTNGGVAPLEDLGVQTSLIASRKGRDGRQTEGHVDDYWISYGMAGPDPWETGSGEEHLWDSIADYLGTSQWKWDFVGTDGEEDFNTDGTTALWTYDSGSRLDDYIPPASSGSPQTALTHGMRLFAESRGYEVLDNFTQRIEPLYEDGFSFADYMAEIDSEHPVMIQLEGHSMVGVGYNAEDRLVYVHNTWDNEIHEMVWGGSYAGMDHIAVTVIHLAPTASTVPEPATVVLLSLSGIVLLMKRTPGRTARH